MRGEVLSSVELVLPSAVVETCYNIKRDGQARFRAVNNEEKTKSEITVAKQEDDSVKIQVIVVSLTCLTEEELREEIGLTTPNKENSRRPAVRGRKGIRRKGGLGFSRKPKGFAKKKLSLQRRTESLPADTAQEETNSISDVPVKDTEPINEEVSTITNLSENNCKEAGAQVGEQTFNNSPVPTPVVKPKGNKAIVRRGGRGRGRGRNLGSRRGIGRGLSNRRVSSTSHKYPEVGSHTLDNSAEEPKVLEEEPNPKLTTQDSPADCTTAASKTDQETPEPKSKSVLPKGRGKRVRRNSDRSIQSYSDSASPPKVCRLRRKVTQVDPQPDSASSITQNKTVNSTADKHQDSYVTPSAADPAKKVATRKRKAVVSVEGTEEAAQLAQNHSTDKAESGEKFPVVKPEEEVEVTKTTVRTKPTKTRAKKIKSTTDDPEVSNTNQDVHDRIQSQAAADVPPQNPDQSPETVENQPLPKRKGKKPQAKKKVSPAKKKLPQEQSAQKFPPTTESPIETFRVKTKAQLKQKPTELANLSDNDADTHSSKIIDKTNTAESVSKQASKKPAKKSNTLARIWRTRKKSGFTHKKKSKPKSQSLTDAERETHSFDTEKTTTELVAETLQSIGTQESTDLPDEQVQTERDHVIPNKEKASPRTGRVENTYEEEEKKDISDLDHAQIEENKKLPQKKRHTAKLAAERLKAADRAKAEQARAEQAWVEQAQAEQIKADEARKSSEVTGKRSTVQDTVSNTPKPISSSSIKADQAAEIQSSEAIAADVSLDLFSTCSDFNETNAIESLIQLSSATDDQPNTTTTQDCSVPEELQAEPDHGPVNGVPCLEPPVLHPEVPVDEVNSAIQSISEQNLEKSTTNNETEETNSDVIQQLMKIATEAKSESSEDAQQARPGKRAYKREFKVQCRFCDVKVKDYGYLFRHIKKLHNDRGAEMKQHLEEIRPLMRTPCPICHKMVSSISNISSHIKQCHATKDSAVLCPICKKTYKTTVSLRQHLRQCHQPQQHRFFCHLCSANFTEKRSLKEHINCSHETTQVFQCDDCGKSFLTKGRLRRHKYIHGDFRHKCNYCGKGFHLKDNMNKHIEIVHEKTQGKRFSCPHCDKKFTVKGNMTQHVMGVHLKQFQYTCPQCHTGFRRKKDMLSHMMKHGDTDLQKENPTHSAMSDESSNHSENSESNLRPIESPWHGKGEKTEVITGITDDGGQGVASKTKVIIISPLAGYPSS